MPATSRIVEPRAERCSSCSAISATIWRCSRCRWRWRRLALAWTRRLVRRPSACWRASGRAAPNAGVNLSQALNIWIIQIVVAIGPPLGGLIFMVYMKTDWGISLFFLTPLALVAIPALRLHKMALFHIAAIWLVITLAALAASPYIAAPRDGGQSQRRFELWRALAAGPRTDAGLAHAFPLAMGRGRRHHRDRRADDVLQSGSSGAVHAGRSLVVGADVARGGEAAWLHRHLRTSDGRLPACEAWMAANAQDAEHSPSPRSASSTAIPVRRSAGRSISCRRRSRFRLSPLSASAGRGSASRAAITCLLR